MKKLFLFTVLVLFFAAAAHGQEVKLDFRASGFIDARTQLWQWNNSTQMPHSQGIINVVTPNNKPPTFDPKTGANLTGGQWNRTASYMDSRGRLKFDAIMGKSLSGTVFFEMDSTTWGDASNSTTSQSNKIGYFQGDRAGVEIKNLYFDVAVPYVPVPMTVRFGLQPFGTRSNIFMYSDGTGITAAAKIDPVEIIGYWIKALEGKIATSDDVTAWGLQVNAKIDTFTLGGYGFYFNHQTYPMVQSNPTLVSDPSTGYGQTFNPIRGPMWWLGAFADGRLGPVNINFDFIYDFGHFENKVVAGVPKVDYNGWVTRLKVDYPWEAFNFGFVGAYGSGADAQKTSQFGTPGEPVADPAFAAAGVKASKVSSYVVPVEAEPTSATESEVLFMSYINAGITGTDYVQDNTRVGKGAYGGLWFAKLYGAYKVTRDYIVTLQGLYIGDTTSHGDTFGTAQTGPGASSLKNGSTIGWEVDLINEWQVYRNLVFRFGGGVLFPGDALKFWDPVHLENVKPNNPWIFTTRLVYSF